VPGNEGVHGDSRQVSRNVTPRNASPRNESQGRYEPFRGQYVDRVVLRIVQLDDSSRFAQQNRNNTVAASLVAHTAGIAVDEHALASSFT
jgi:hypothetical protein